MKKKSFIAGIFGLVIASVSQAGFDEGLAAHNNKEYPKALEEFQNCSSDSRCQYALGLMYVFGHGLSKDEALAVQWFQKAANQGHATAQYNLGVMYRDGQGVAKDEAFAVQWFQKAAEQGDASAQYNLGVAYANGQGVAKDEALAVQWYQKAAEQGHAGAQTNLGVIYEYGRGVAKDEALAVQWYQKAANQGHATAQFNLGLAYINGYGVTKDEALAVQWYQKAADQGYANAQASLGYMYASGLGGLKQNWAWATYWSAKAAQQGHQIAIKNLNLYKSNLRQLSVNTGSLNLRNKPSVEGEKVGSLTRGTNVYRMGEENGFTEIYVPKGHKLGYVATKFVVAANQSRPTSQANSPFPPRPAPQAGRTVCSTRCLNAQCYRTYSDGRQVKFTAKQVWDPFNNTFKFDSGGC